MKVAKIGETKLDQSLYSKQRYKPMFGEEDPLVHLENRNRQIDTLTKKTEERICEAEDYLTSLI